MEMMNKATNTYSQPKIFFLVQVIKGRRFTQIYLISILGFRTYAHKVKVKELN